MNQMIKCDIIRDLFPIYLEGLASEASASAVEEHLQNCEDCQVVYEDMRKPLPVEPQEYVVVDSLRKFRRSLKLRSVVILLLIAFILGGLLKVFVLGSPISYQEVQVEKWMYNEDSATVTLEGYLIPGKAVSRFKLTPKADTNEVYLTVYSVEISPFFSNRYFSITVPFEKDTVIVWSGDDSPMPVVTNCAFASYIGYVEDNEPCPQGGLTADRTNIRKLREIIENAQDTPVIQKDDLPSTNYIEITLGNDSITQKDFDRECDIRHYAYERDGRYYLEEIKRFYGEEYELRENTYIRDVVATIANRKYVREISDKDYNSLLRIIQEIVDDQHH